VNIPNWAREVLPIAREAGATIACDLQDVTSADDPYRLDFVDGADIVFFSAAKSVGTRGRSPGHTSNATRCCSS